MASKKDYKAIAQIIKDWTTDMDDDEPKHSVIEKEPFIGSLVQYFTSDNPNLDSERFRQACE